MIGSNTDFSLSQCIHTIQFDFYTGVLVRRPLEKRTEENSKVRTQTLVRQQISYPITF
jgi:hypothetical protein